MNTNRIKQFIINYEIDELERYIGQLSEKERTKTKNYLLGILKNTTNGNERNMIAYVLGDLKYQDADKILIDLIFRDELKNNRGTLIHALGELECAEYIPRLLPLLYEGNYEVAMNTHILLQEHVSKMNIIDREKCIKILKTKIQEYEKCIDILYDVYENIFGCSLDV